MKISCEEKCQWEIAYKPHGSLEWIDAIITSIIKDKSALCNRPKLKEDKQNKSQEKVWWKLYNRCYKILNGLNQLFHQKFKNSPEYPPPPTPRQVPTKYLREILYLILKENSFQFCSSNYLYTYGTAMGTTMAVAFANILIENQILRQSCIKRRAIIMALD